MLPGNNTSRKGQVEVSQAACTPADPPVQCFTRDALMSKSYSGGRPTPPPVGEPSALEQNSKSTTSQEAGRASSRGSFVWTSIEGCAGCYILDTPLIVYRAGQYAAISNFHQIKKYLHFFV